MLDTVCEVQTPEGVVLRLPIAGSVPRALAWLIDLGIRLSILSASSIVLSLLDQAGLGVYLVTLFVVVWCYPILCEGLFNGQTPGKRALGLRVVSSEGAPVGWLASVVRNLLRTVDMLPFGYGCGLVCSLLDPHGRRLGDLVAGTLVVHVQTQALLPDLGEGDIVAPALPLRTQEQIAVVAFAERAPYLTLERQYELANIVTPVTEAVGEAGVLRLVGVARWLLGGR